MVHKSEKKSLAVKILQLQIIHGMNRCFIRIRMHYSATLFIENLCLFFNYRMALIKYSKRNCNKFCSVADWNLNNKIVCLPFFFFKTNILAGNAFAGGFFCGGALINKDYILTGLSKIMKKNRNLSIQY